MRAILLVAIFLVTLAKVPAQDVSGNWFGNLNVGVTLKLVFHLSKSADGSYKGTMDSPDQGVNGIPCSVVQVTSDSVKVQIDAIKGQYTGKFTSDSTLSGTWMQGPANVSLDLRKVAVVPVTEHPQTPKPPFAYQAQDVEFDNPDKSAHLAGTLTFPKSGGPFPTAILISGSGQQDRDETLLGHKPFAIIADDLTKRGFAVLRVDDRGTGKSRGDVVNSTSADFAKDVLGAIAYLKGRSEVDKQRIGLIGHSEGGLIAQIIAAENKAIHFVVLLAGPGIKGAELIAGQVSASLISEGVPPAAAEAYVPFYMKVLNSTAAATDTATAMKTAINIFQKWKSSSTAEQRAAIGYTDDVRARDMLSGLVRVFSMPWFKYFVNSDPAALLRKMTCKVLALNGEKDVQVLSKPNIAGIKAALQTSKVKSFETRELPGLNHLFQTCTRCSVSEYSQLSESFSPVALTAIGEWLIKNVKP
ncbi:alpha/beta hydrolase [Segetibacter sp. 3557_3]|uniref:alpha/beta hydrolase family protein n=1 Tax=Segetibacter sp. 3557_3 TaxID=2547429 RepID=UPI001058ACA9|nr:alpha/beta hydrolase [Segetibacter sp. 3557_3]TDH20898.1 alpha/beta hydrolase [Segetibacter sp. 3557_3]